MSPENFTCPACAAVIANPALKAANTATASPAYFPIVSCTGCGLLALWPQPSDEILAASYTSVYYQPHGFSLLARTFNYIFRAWSRQRLRLLQKLKSRGRFLDVGCGAGELVAQMLRLGYDAYGMDVSIAINKVIPPAVQSRITIAPLEQCDYPAGSFDLIMLSDVLEHVREPHALLRQLRQLLKDDGCLIISVPNWQDPEVRVFGQQYWHNLDAPRHLWHFTDASLQRLSDRAGFKLVSNFDLYPLTLLEAPLSLVHGWRRLLAAKVSSPLIHHLLLVSGTPFWFLATPIWRLINYHQPRQLRIVLAKKTH